MATTAAPLVAATRTRPAKNHTWQIANIGGQRAAVALPCPNCPSDLLLQCLNPRHGIMRLELPGASVANGRSGATKQIRLIVDGQLQRRRAVTRATSRGYTPIIDIAADDPLLDALASAKLLRLNFYGQRSFVGLGGAGLVINQIRKTCRSSLSVNQNKHCVWTVLLSCSPTRSIADETALAHPRAFVRAMPEGYCAVIATSDLAHGRSIAKETGGELRRSCL